tara:strand:+ start:890 stop:1588 length:699 start_codon:yes stop_codon:yes gene_type:complete
MKLDIFISGENVDLCIPTKEFSLKSNWFSWFNDSNNTKYLEQGLYPNTREDQMKFFTNSKNRFILMISLKNKYNYIGTVSLSNINFLNKSCELAIVRDMKKNSISPILSSLESIALITQHAFEKMGMKRISAGQHRKLEKWQNQMELIGYKLEGIHKNKAVKGNNIDDTVSISCCYDDFLYLKKSRGELFWDGNDRMKTRYKKKIKLGQFSQSLKKFFEKERNKYYKKVFEL